MSRTVLCFLFAAMVRVVCLAQPAPRPEADDDNKRGASKDEGPWELEDCVQYALEYAPELRRARIAYDNQKLNTMLQRARFDVLLSANARRVLDAERDDAELVLARELAGGIELSATLAAEGTQGDDLGRYALAISKTLLGGGTVRETRLEVDLSLLDETIALNQIAKLQRQRVLLVKQSYYELIRNRQTARIRELRLEGAKRNLLYAKERERPIDIATAEIDVLENENALLRAQRQSDSSLDALKVVMGMMPQDWLEVAEAFEFAVEPTDPDSDIQYTYEFQEDFLNLALERNKLDLELDAARTRLWPDLSVSASYAQNSQEDFRFDGEDDVTLGVMSSWNLERRRDRANHGRLQNLVRDKELEILDSQQEKAREIRDLSRRLAEAEKSIQLQEAQVQMGERLVELYEDRWNHGEIDIVEYVRSQNSLETSKVELINQETSYMGLLAEYHYAVGR